MATAGSTWYATAQWSALKRSQYPYVFAEGTVVRYIDVFDARDLESIVTYVKALPDTSALVVNNELLDGTWTTLGAGYEPVNPSDVGGTIRIWHALIPAGTTAGTDFYVTDNGCKYRVSLSFFWRLKTFPPVMPLSTSGVQYSIGGVSRDPLSGLWSCIMEKRERISQTTGQWTAGESVLRKMYRRVWLGIRDGEVTDTGATPELDTVGNPVAGTLVEETRSKNEDCTHDIDQTKSVAKTVVDATKRYVYTLFARRTESKTLATTPLAAPVAPAGGVHYEHVNVIREDGKTDTEVVGVAEQTVADAEVTVDDDVFARTVTKAHRSQAAAIESAGNPSPRVLIGTKADKTEGAAFNNVETTKTAKPVTDAIVSFARTLYNAVTSKQHVAQASPPTSAPSPVAGLIIKRDGKKRADGAYDVGEEFNQELSVPLSERTVTKTAFSTVTREVNKSQSASMPDPTVAGVTVANVKTEGALITQTHETIDPVAVADATVLRTGNFIEDTVRRVNRNQSSGDAGISGLTAPGTLSAKITTIRNDVTNESKVDTDRSEETPRATFALAITWTMEGDRDGELYIFSNQTAIGLQSKISTLSRLASVHPSVSINRFGLFDGSLTATYFTSWEVTPIPWSHNFTEYERLASGEVLEKSGVAKFAQNVTDGAGEFYSTATPYYNGSWFRPMSDNWYEYKKITSVSIKSP